MTIGATQIGILANTKGIPFESQVFVLASTILLVSAVLWADRPPTMEKTDFSVTYVGSRMVYLGLGSQLYDLDEQRKLKQTLLPDAEALIFEHPPFEALILAPLGALPYKMAYLIWGLVNAAIWLALPYLLRPYATTPQDDLGYLVLWLIFAPLGVALFQGQSSLLVLLFYSLAFIELKKGRDFRAGAVFGLALLKFQFAIPLALILLLRGKWRFTKGFLATAVVLGGLSLLAVGWQRILSYFRLLSGIGSHPDNLSYGAAAGMATVEGFVHALLANIVGQATISMLVAGISIFLLAWTAWRWNDTSPVDDPQNFDLMFASAIVVSLVTGFHMFTHDLSPLMLAILLVAANLPAQRTLRWTLIATMAIFFFPPIYFALMAWHCMYLMFPALMVFALATSFAQALIARGGASSGRSLRAGLPAFGDQ